MVNMVSRESGPEYLYFLVHNRKEIIARSYLTTTVVDLITSCVLVESTLMMKYEREVNALVEWLS